METTLAREILKYVCSYGNGPKQCFLEGMEYWSLGILEPWNHGILESWNLGILESWNMGKCKPCQLVHFAGGSSQEALAGPSEGSPEARVALGGPEGDLVLGGAFCVINYREMERGHFVS